MDIILYVNYSQAQLDYNAPMNRPLLILGILIAAFAAWLLWPEGGTPSVPGTPENPPTLIDTAPAGTVRGRVL